MPHAHLLSEALRVLEVVAAARLWADAGDCRVRLASCGGEGVGKLWGAVPDRREVILLDPHWRIAFRMRLGMPIAEQGARCQQRRADERPCLCPLDPEALHAHLCKAGPARLRPHRAMARALGRVVRTAGGHVDYERAMPHLEAPAAQQGQEAVLDVVITWPTLLEQHAVDVTIRCPVAARYNPGAAVPGCTAEQGEAEKRDRYGHQVMPLAFETWGRLGDKGIAAMKVLAAAARTLASDPRDTRNLLARWRLELEAALSFAQADVMLLAAGSKAHVVRDGSLAARARVGTRAVQVGCEGGV